MRILIAEDEPVSRRLLQGSLEKWGYEVCVTSNGLEAWEALQRSDSPSLAVLDWLMPGLDGVEVCRKLRQLPARESSYIILLTAKGEKDDVIKGLEAGADDYVTKPFNAGELKARVQVGARVVGLQSKLAQNVRELTDALSRVKQLQGLLPICAYCKKIRDDKNYWHKVESYLGNHSEVRFSHGVCPECTAKLREELAKG